MTPNRSSSPATDFAVALLGSWIRLGLRDVVLSPGSRSQALALAAAEFERRGLLRLRVRIDERVGGFLALGLAVETGLPVLIITTSGTAVANLHPAVLEAHHSGVPLIVLSADRPDELRGIGSNQTADQQGIFGTAITRSWEIDAPVGDPSETDVAALVARSSWSAARAGHRGRPCPVHLNLALTEPLSGPVVIPDEFGEGDAGLGGGDGDAGLGGGDVGDADVVDGDVDEADLGEASIVELVPAPGTVVVAGAGAGAQAEAVAHALGAPLLAEVSSGARFGPNLVVMYRELLATAGFGDRIDRVVVFGHPTLSREIPALIQRDGVTTIVVRTPGADDFNPGHRVETFADGVRVAAPAAPAAASAAGAAAANASVSAVSDVSAGRASALRAWTGRWVAASRELLEPEQTEFGIDLADGRFARRQLKIVREPVDRRMLAEAVWRATWPHDRLVLGASRLIREADRSVVGKKIRVHSNRGLAGIDGTIATAIGIALASQAVAPESASAMESAMETTMAEAPHAPRTSGDHSAGGTTRVLLGDLTALHDAGALAFGAGELRPRIQVIVGNDGGGTIFDGLEVAATAPAAALDRVLLTGQLVDFEKLSAAYGWDYLRVANRGELDEALGASAGPMLIEVALAR